MGPSSEEASGAGIGIGAMTLDGARFKGSRLSIESLAPSSVGRQNLVNFFALREVVASLGVALRARPRPSLTCQGEPERVPPAGNQATPGWQPVLWQKYASREAGAESSSLTEVV